MFECFGPISVFRCLDCHYGEKGGCSSYLLYKHLDDRLFDECPTSISTCAECENVKNCVELKKLCKY